MDTPRPGLSSSYLLAGRYRLGEPLGAGGLRMVAEPATSFGSAAYARRQISIGGSRQPMWRKDGRELFFVNSTSKFYAVEVRPGGSISTPMSSTSGTTMRPVPTGDASW